MDGDVPRSFVTLYELEGLVYIYIAALLRLSSTRDAVLANASQIL